jgi:cell division protein FtsI/penicillin-binding protein 2
LAGYESGVITPGQTFHDATIKIAGTPPKGSYKTLGPVNDHHALRLSSNVYMFYIALRMGGEYRHPLPNDSKVNFNVSAFQDMRNYFGQFGLGVKTGIDFPFEASGYVGTELQAGKLMDLAIGQYDTYTTMQLAQYVATIANDGYRVRPHFLKEVRLPTPYDNEIGSLFQSSNTEVLNKIEMDTSEIQRVQEGFRSVFTSGTGSTYWANKDYRPAGKTGTAENEVYPEINGKTVKVDTENLTLVGYAPYEDPEIAFAVVAPNLGARVSNQYQIGHTIGTGILDAYFDLKKERESGVKSGDKETDISNEEE